MYYVYLLRSIQSPDQIYFGCTQDVKERLAEHNSGKSTFTSRYKPWEIITSIEFKNKDSAFAFEKYLKSSAGRAFASKHFW